MTAVRGTAAALWTLSRPVGAVWVASLALLGVGFGHWNRALPLQDGPGIVALVCAWWSLNAGSLWLNAALDRDQGAVLLGRPAPVPDTIEAWSALALSAAFGLAWLADPLAGLAALACVALAVAYSHPATAWKGHPVLGPAVNVVGYGILSPLAGLAVVGAPLDARTAAAVGCVALWVAGLYFAAQAFQGDEDAARGYRTMVVTHGPVVTLSLARASLALAALVASGLAVAGWFPRAALVGAPGFFLADRYVAAWQSVPGGGDERWARGLVVRLLLAGWVLLGGVTADYLWRAQQGLPTAGLGTMAGRPETP